MQDKIKEGTPNPFGDDLFEASAFISKHIWSSIEDVITSARKVMDYVKDVADVYAQHNKHMEWVTPTGWLVLQQYHDLEKKRIKTHINGNTVSLSFPKEIENKVNKQRTGLGSSPNFIHSLDAAAMTKTINRCAEQNIEDFAMVHDSYGTHSPLMPKMSEILREEFVNMYEEHDVLTELRDHAIKTIGTEDIPLPPSKGNLDLRNVLKSDYFFA
jgi:DNA-directed RNA polymerase